MHNVSSDLAITKIHALSLSLSLVDIAAERWEKGEKDPRWVTRNESGQFAKNSGTSNKPEDIKETLDLDGVLKLAKSKLAEIKAIINEKFSKLTKVEKQFVNQVLRQPEIQFFVEKFREPLKKISEPISGIFRQINDRINNLKKINPEEIEQIILDYIDTPQGKNLIQITSFVATAGVWAVLTVAASNAIIDGLMLAGLEANYGARALVAFGVAELVGETGFNSLVKSIFNWQTTVVNSKTSLKESEEFLKVTEGIKKVFRKIFNIADAVLPATNPQDSPLILNNVDFTKSRDSLKKQLRVSDKEAAQVVITLASMGIDPNKVVAAITDYKKLNSAYSKIDMSRKLFGEGALSRHTLENRLLELVNLTKDRSQALLEGKSTEDIDIGIQWRKGIVESELKYGQTLTELTLSSYYHGVDDNSRKAYKKLIEKIAEGKSNNSNMRQMNPIRRALFHFNALKLDDYRRGRIQSCIEEAKRFSKLINHDLDVQFDIFEKRGYAIDVDINDPEGKHKLEAFLITNKFLLTEGSEYVINVGEMSLADSLAWHELGHALEDKAKLSKYTHDYIKSRRTSTQMFKLNTLSPNYGDEEAYTTDLTHPYIGKVYKFPGTDITNNSELISMGTQALSNIQETKELASIDRDHLLFALWALDSKKAS